MLHLIPSIMPKALVDRLGLISGGARSVAAANAQSIGVAGSLPVTFWALPASITPLALGAVPFEC